LSFGVIAMH